MRELDDAPWPHTSSQHPHIVWDAGNGASAAILPDLVAHLPGRHRLLFAEIDGTFPNHHPDPTEAANLVALRDAILADQADFGIAFDGDGDRIGLVDGQGEILWGDHILMLLAREVLAERPGARIIADVKASQGVVDEVTRLGGIAEIACTGHSLIKQRMRESGALLAGEMSGHIFMADRWYGFDDALYAALRIIGLVVRSERSLAALREGLPRYYATPELRFSFPETKTARSIMDEIKAGLDVGAGDEVLTIDGLRVTDGDGWWLVRPSNTQPVLVARCEGRDPDALRRISVKLASLLERVGVTGPSGLGKG